ncbi:hypothetical protein Tco_0473016 [Tanacetum coccineum]
MGSTSGIRAKIVVSDDEEDKEDSSKQGRSLIEDMDLDTGISLELQLLRKFLTSEALLEGSLVDLLNLVADEIIYKEREDRMERAATTASSLDAEQDIGHIKYALTKSPTIYVSLIEQFWQTASASTPENGEMEITATIDGKVKVVSEASIRRHLKLEDSDGISTLPNAEIFEQLALMGYKKTAWEQFSSNIATAIICLATNRTFNFSKLIFEAMNVHGEGSTIRVESHNTPTSAPSTSQPITSSPSMQTTYAAPMPHDSPIPRVHSLGSDEGSLTLNELTGRCLIEDMDLDGGILLVPPHVADQGRFDDTHVSDQPEEQL